MPFLLHRFWRYSKGNRVWVTLYVTLFIIANGISALWPLAVARLLNLVQEKGITHESLPNLSLYLGSFLLLGLGFWVFHGPARFIEQVNAFLVRANYKKYLLDGVMDLPIKWHSEHHSGDSIDKVEKGTTALFRFSNTTFQLIESAVRLVSSFILLAYFNFYSVFVVMAVIFVAINIIAKFDKILVRQYRSIFAKENKISEKIFDSISNITTVVVLRIEKLVASAIFQKIMEPLPLVRKNVRVNETKWFVVSMCSHLMTVLVLGLYFIQKMSSDSVVLVGTMYALYGYVDRMNDIFYRFASMYGEMVQQRAAIANAEEISKEFNQQESVTPIRIGAKWEELKVDELSFSYNTAKTSKLHLDNVSMNIRSGARVALIGESGSGKTTFLKLIRELYPAKSLKLYLDGKHLDQGFGAISSEISLIPQDPEIFSATIRENITMGVAYNDEHIKRFTDMACVSEVIRRLPNGLDSFMNEKGVNLSGGQKQRLALARGLLACENKSIILLDEPTSSVDPQNELQIFQNIFTAFRGKTIIATVHRLHLLSLFEEIYYFSNGKIIASGSFYDLKKNSSDFNRVWEKYQVHTK